MTYELITDLSESRTFRTRNALNKFSKEEAEHFFYALLLAHLVLMRDEDTRTWAQKEFSRAVTFGNFDYFRISINDLYTLTYMMTEVHDSITKIMDARLYRIYRFLGRGHFVRSEIEPVCLRLERMLGIDDPQLRIARRTMIDWEFATPAKRKMVLHYLRINIRKYSFITEVLPFLDILDKKEGRNV